MRVGLPTAGFLLTSVIGSLAAVTVNMSPPRPAKIQAPVKPTAKDPVQAKVICPCDCPKDQVVRQHAQAHRAPRRTARHFFRHYAGSGYYRYGTAAPFIQHDWHGQWHVAPNDAYIPGPQAYGPPRYDHSQQDVQVDSRGWTGGVGDGGFVDGYGQVHFANGGLENGPTYNSYNQSFQYNPSQAGSFQPRSMGGYAPPHR